MKVSREQVAENRRKILEAASRLFRERGYAGVTVAEVMRAAGLTHGGFYGHFASKDDLIAETLAQPFGETVARDEDLARYAKRYLSPSHRADLGGGCPMAALAAETVREAPEARAAMTAGLRAQLARLTDAAEGATQAKRRRAAIGSWAAMVGALVLSRMSDDAALSDEILTQTRAFLHDKAGTRTA
jgi:TetR/AcrR family transcriptional regulator, transcriptional repressor for nem operon